MGRLLEFYSKAVRREEGDSWETPTPLERDYCCLCILIPPIAMCSVFLVQSYNLFMNPLAFFTSASCQVLEVTQVSTTFPSACFDSYTYLFTPDELDRNFTSITETLERNIPGPCTQPIPPANSSFPSFGLGPAPCLRLERLDLASWFACPTRRTSRRRRVNDGPCFLLFPPKPNDEFLDEVIILALIIAICGGFFLYYLREVCLRSPICSIKPCCDTLSSLVVKSVPVQTPGEITPQQNTHDLDNDDKLLKLELERAAAEFEDP